jgi:hypothetical protein
MTVMPHRSSMTGLIAATLALLLGACHHNESNEAKAPSPPDTSSSDTAQSRAKAVADGAQAARGIARSLGVKAPQETDPADIPPSSEPDRNGYVELDWLKMMPPEDLEALKHPPPIRHTGSTRMKQFGSSSTVADVANRKIKLPGYVVPIESDDQGRMTEFFFVPFFGACIHVPPPPPNQIVYARLATPIKTPEIWDPYWLRGELRVETKKNKLAGSAYTMADASLVPYDG